MGVMLQDLECFWNTGMKTMHATGFFHRKCRGKYFWTPIFIAGGIFLLNISVEFCKLWIKVLL
jgi:hypothetical protein